MESKYSQIRGAGLGLAAISYDSPAVLRHFSDRMQVKFPMLSDTDSAIIRHFGILNTTVSKDTPIYGIPYPGIYLLDANGVVKSKFFEDDYKERDTAGMILLQQFGITPEKAEPVVSGKHISLAVSATEPSPHMGQHLSLVLEATLPKRVHVYAPGVKGYIPIDWQLSDSPAFKVGPANYPQSKMMRLEAIKETVPVYADHFQLTRTIALGNEKDIVPLLDGSGNFVVESTFRYQACDDEKCFIPESVPVKVTLHFQKLDRTRVPESLQRR